jgi:calcineurin-like phosphoesterase family protein
MNVFFYSDPHFGDQNLIDGKYRPFKSVSEMNGCLINNYKKLVKDDDLVIWLGDCVFGDEWEQACALPGKRILIKGNHDCDLDKLSKLNFLFIKDEDFIVINKKLCRLSHHPYSNIYKGVVRNFLEKGQEDFLIHGHTHQGRKIVGNQIHIGVDSWNYCPVSLYSIKYLINNQICY